MWLADISIKRPVLATVMSLLLVTFGIVGFTSLSVREYPDIDPPVVSVTTVYPGSNAQVVESTVTEILEDEIIGIQGIRSMTSVSKEETSSIVIEFILERNVDVAAQDVRDRVQRARSKLPDDIDEPVISKQDTDASAVMWIGLSGDANFSPLEITDYADRYIVDKLQTVSGVGNIIIGGAREYSMRLWLDPVKMATRGVTVSDVDVALRAENVEAPSGRIEGVAREFTVRTLGEMKSAEEFNRLIIKQKNGVPVYLADIGKAEIGPRDVRSFVRFMGKPAVGLGIVKQSKANTLEVARGVKAKLKEIRPNLPSGLTLQSAYDTSIFIQKSIDDVIQSLFIAFLLVVLVIYLFLGNLRATFIPAISIPVSLIGCFALMYFLGFTINVITLLALTLAIGLVVDDNIVVLENIYRRIEEGEPPLEAAFSGIREIGFAVIATTVALVAVFIPIIFIKGVTGRLLTEFALVLAGAVVISTFVALTLSPMLCSLILKTPEKVKLKKSNSPLSNDRKLNLQEKFDAFYHDLTERYERTMTWAFGKRGLLVGVIVALAIFTALTYKLVPKEFLPADDRSTLFTIVKTPEGSTMEYTDRAMRQAEALYDTIPQVRTQFSVVALAQEGVGKVNQGFMFVGLTPTTERPEKQDEIVSSVMAKMSGIPEADVIAFGFSSSPVSSFGKPIQMAIQGDSIDELIEVSEKVVARASTEIPGFVAVDRDLKRNKPQLNISINRSKASELGVSVRDIARTLQVVLAGDNISTFNLNNKRYDVMVQADRSYRLTPDKLNTIYIRSNRGGDDDDESSLVPLTNVLNWEETAVPPQIGRYNRRLAATIEGVNIPAPIFSFGKIAEQLQEITKEEMLPGMAIAWKGEAKEYFDAGYATLYAFLLAMIISYLVLSAQFESFSDPIIILLTVPLAVIGAILTLFSLSFFPMVLSAAVPWLFKLPILHELSLIKYSLNVYSQIGLILLIGLVTKNGILIVEFANQMKERHPEWTHTQAVKEAARLRFRPILMTSVATIMGAMPIAVGLGSGIDSRKPLGAVIVGGMLLSTFLAIYVIPIAYAWLKELIEERNQGGVQGRERPLVTSNK